MMLYQRGPIALFPIWCLLSLWLFFGCEELAEQAYAAPETVAEEQEQDLDQEALLQLASGLKPDVPCLTILGCASCIAEVAKPQFQLSVDSLHLRAPRHGHGPPSRRLHQQLSVYLI